MASAVVADFIKDPNDVLDYTWDWSGWLPTGDSISSSIFIATSGITVGTGAQAATFTATHATVWLSGGTSSIPYSITNRITTVQGRTSDRTITVRVQPR